MILVVQNSKELDVQRKLFLESMSLVVSIVKPRTSSHQAIAETLDELQVCAQLFINNLNSLICLFLCHLPLYLLDCLKLGDVDYDQQNNIYFCPFPLRYNRVNITDTRSLK